MPSLNSLIKIPHYFYHTIISNARCRKNTNNSGYCRNNCTFIAYNLCNDQSLFSCGSPYIFHSNGLLRGQYLMPKFIMCKLQHKVWSSVKYHITDTCRGNAFYFLKFRNQNWWNTINKDIQMITIIYFCVGSLAVLLFTYITLSAPARLNPYPANVENWVSS
jgi:hypothetical protein